MKFCPECGTKLVSQKFCHECGCDISKYISENNIEHKDKEVFDFSHLDSAIEQIEEAKKARFEDFCKKATVKDGVCFSANFYNEREITIPCGIKEIANGALSYCKYLTNIYVDEDNLNFKSINGVLYSSDGKTLIQFPISSQIEEYSVPYGVEKLSKSAFSSSKVRKVTLPSTLVKIEENCFSKCQRLEEIFIPDSVERIGENAFEDCISLERISLGNGIKTVEDNAFFYCVKIKEVTIPESVEHLGAGVFMYCRGLEKAELPKEPRFNTLNGTFYGCASMTEFNIPNNITEIGNGTFYGWEGLREITIPPNVKKIGALGFGECGKLTTVNLSNGLETICSRAFFKCNELKDITIPSSVETIESEAFSGINSITIRIKRGKNYDGLPQWWQQTSTVIEY